MTAQGTPRFHLVTSDAVVSAAGFVERAAEVLRAHGGVVALHVRAHGLPGRTLCDAAAALVQRARETGGLVLVNDRLDVALVAGAHGAQLGRRSLSVRVARRLLGQGARIGYSAHSVAESVTVAAEGVDFVVLGTIYATRSHPERSGAGPALVAETAGAVRVPVLAIGGITPERVADVLAAGAHGVAVLSGVWHEADPVAAVGRYLEALVNAS